MNDLTTETTAPTDPIAELLQNLRASPELRQSTAGMELMLRVEQALVEANDHGMGRTQITNFAKMKAFMDFGKFAASGKTSLPDHLRNNPADCTAIAMRADRWGLDFYGVAEKTHMINGKMGYEGQLVGAILKNMGAHKEDALVDEYIGDWSKIIGKFVQRESTKKMDEHGKPVKYMVPAWRPEDEAGLGIRVWGTLPNESSPRVIEIFMAQALVRNSTQWTTDPKQQIFYLAEKKWARKYAPSALLGVKTTEDLLEEAGTKNMGAVEEVADDVSQDLLKRWRTESGKGWDASAAFWKTIPAETRKKISDVTKQEMQTIAQAADKARTVDNGTKTEAAAAPAQAAATTTAAAPSGEAAAEPAAGTAAAAADADGVVDADFVRALDAAENAGNDVADPAKG